jgi:hypothetical protein
MALDSAQTAASGGAFRRPRSIHAIVRGALALGALWLLVEASDRYQVWVVHFTGYHQVNVGLWLSATALASVAGLLFGLAVFVPFGPLRFAWSRLPLAAVAVAPGFGFWWLYLRPGPIPTGLWGLATSRLMAQPHVQFAIAVLSGVALAACLTPRRPTD